MEKFIKIGDKTLKYTLNRKKVKNINLRLKPTGEITVSANRFVTLQTIERFLISKSDFIFKHLEKIKSLPSGNTAVNNGSALLICGKEYALTVKKGKRNIKTYENTVIVTLDDINDEAAKIRMINNFYKQKAIALITEISHSVYPLYKENTNGFPTLKFRNMKTKWGVCRPQRKEITFNTRLILLPKELAEYVVFHEFTHFSVPDHSKMFYAKLAQNLPDYKYREQRLKNFVLFDFPK